jgi:cob(I)alamin adenosyltransferase
MIDELIRTADEEIERTSQEAVKAVLVEVGAELAAEQKKRGLYEKKVSDLEYENRNLKEENAKLAKQLKAWKIGGTLCGAAVTGITFGIIIRGGGR